VIAALGLCCGALMVAMLIWAAFRSGGL